MIICKYCGYGNPDNSGCCEKCGAPNREAFAKTREVNITRNIFAISPSSPRGIDVSHWDGRIDWARVKPQIDFAILKCTESTNFIDDTYAFNKAGCEINGIPHGVYHFFRSNTDPIEQAELFYRTAADNNLCFYCVDVEANNGGDIRNNLKMMLERLEQLTGHIPWIYTAKYFWNDNIGAQSWASRCPLWVANYGVASPALPNGWTKWGIWQYSDKGTIAGINASVDLDWYNGDMASMYDYFKNGNEAPEPMRVRVNVANLTIRSAPLVQTNTVLGYTSYGKIWTVEDVVKDATNRTWYQVGQNVYLGGFMWYGQLLTVPI